MSSRNKERINLKLKIELPLQEKANSPERKVLHLLHFVSCQYQHIKTTNCFLKFCLSSNDFIKEKKAKI